MKTRVGMAALAALGLAGAAQAVVIVPGTYRLTDHPDGSGEPSAPPNFGMVLDYLYDVSGGQDPFTLDFDDPASAMFMDIPADYSYIHIYGKSMSGVHDVTSPTGGWVDDQYKGISYLDYTYSVNVEQVPGDDDLWVVAKMGEHNNTGTLTTPIGEVVNLWDEPMDKGFSFRLGDADDEGGLGYHKTPGTISGIGWLNYREPDVHRYSTDFNFRATLVPAPASAGVLALGLLAARRRRA